ncbi:MAG: sigma 54-interacting transcriptional regulator [Proteobacteria bacterium]|nr:sigma 54-interacting transcriptional regulator [Pseudomonadota bacterium]
MPGLAFSDNAARLHAPLVQRAAAIVGAASCAATPLARVAGDPAPIGPGPCVTLERAARPTLVRDGARGRFTLTYADPASDTTLAALVAALAAPGMPIATNPESLSILALAERLAASEIPVLINGPTGTGKEVLSRFIHARSPRAAKPFVAVNCAAMPDAMLEALLFGHRKGAFTGATEASEGFFRAADGGTLLLDEIAEMPLSLQAKLLRALQEGEVVPIGSTQPIKVDVRVIACANRDLPTEVAEGRFRADLFYRLNVFPLALRPLRERAEDVAPLAFALILRHAAPGKALPWLSDAALAMLRLHGWPGNVRELENVIRRALLLADDSAEILPAHIIFDQPARLVSAESAPIPGQAPAKLSNIVQISEARAIMRTLDACGGSRVAAARQLGISERTLRYRLAAFREAGLAVAGAAR